MGNLFCGCVAIAFILHAQPFLREINNEQIWITGTQQAWLGSLFIFIAALLDLLDGAAARWLGVQSPIGADLDSLADLVTFGVAPSMILMKMLWISSMSRPNAMDVPMWLLAPAFLVACFAALRLARFNQLPEGSKNFKGVPVPAIGLVVASLPLIHFYMPNYVGPLFQNLWFNLALIGVLCWLMISPFQFFSFKLKGWSFKENLLQYILVGAVLMSIPFLKWLSIPLGFCLYVVLSLVNQKKISEGT